MNSLKREAIKLTVLVVLVLLVGSSFAFIPTFAATPSLVASVAKAGPSPATVTGATATMDVPVLATAGNVAVIRTITVTNPTGQPAIDSITISVPKGAQGTPQSSTTSCPANNVVALVTTDSYSQPCGGFYSDSGTSSAAEANTIGTGPWAVTYSTTSGALLPGGASIKLQLGLVTEAADSATGVADPFTLSVAATDSTSSPNTVLPSITIYETTGTTLTVTPSASSVTAGNKFTLSVTGPDSGVPLSVSASGSLSNSKGVSTTTTASPATFTTTSSATSVSVNDTTAETLTLTTSTGTLDAGSHAGGLSASNVITVNAGAASSLAVYILQAGSGAGLETWTTATQPGIINLTSSVFAGGVVPISGAKMQVATADKYGNPASFSSVVTVTVSASLVQGRNGAFSSGTTYTGTYPYNTGSSFVATASVTIPASTSTPVNIGTATSNNYFFGVDYGSESQLVATTSSASLTEGKSPILETFTLSNNGLTVAPTATTGGTVTSPTAGSTETITANLASGAIQQAGVPIYLKIYNTTTDYNGHFSNGASQIEAITAVPTSGTYANEGVITSTLVVDNKAGHATAIQAWQVLASATATLSNNTAATSSTITTVAGSVAALVVDSSFATTANSAGTDFKTANTEVSPGFTLYLNVFESDAYSNLVTVSADTQFAISATSGTISNPTPVLLNTGSSTLKQGLVIVYTPSSTLGSVTITATAAGGFKGTEAVTVVSATPVISLVGPATLSTTTLSAFSGWANVSAGVPGTISGIQYSLNGAANVTVANTTATTYKYGFQILLTKNSTVAVWVEDNQGDWGSATVSVPAITPATRFGFVKLPMQTTLNGNPAANATIINNSGGTLTAYIYFTVKNSTGYQVGIYESQVSIAAFTSFSQTVGLLNLPAGTYTVSVFVLDSTGAPASPPETVTVTIA